MTNYRQTMAETLEFMYMMREYKLMERELTDGEKKKREEIAQDMDDADFKDRYGDRWKEVKMAVATKQAKEEFDEGESIDLDEARQLKNPKKEVMVVKKGKVIVIDKKDAKEYLNKGWELAEEVGLDEDSFNIGDKVKVVPKAKGSKPFSGKITGKLKNGKHEVQVYNKNVSHMDIMVHELVKEEVNIDESARSDAMRAIRKDKDLGKRSSVEIDDFASDDDIKGASKNIIMQMRKVLSLRGNFMVEFGDKKKIKIPEKIAVAVQEKYNSFRKPKDKIKFAEKVAKSYKSMLSALKENTILDRIGKKIQERKEILEVSNRWVLANKKFSLINDKGTYILVTQGTGEEKKLKAKTPQDATQELVKKGYREF